MIMAWAPGFDHGYNVGSGGTAAVIGDDDPITHRIATVLSQHQYDVVYHPSPRDFLAELSSEPGSVPEAVVHRRRGSQVHSPAREPQEPASPPALYVLSYRGKLARGTGFRAFLSALEALNHQSPRRAILVTLDEQAHKIIKAAIRAGADEILSAGDAEIDELVWTRVQSAIAKAWAAPEAAAPRGHSAPAAAPPGVERRVAQRRRADSRGTAAASSPAAPALMSDVEETWEEPASATEVQAASERIRAALERLPSAEARRGPLADVLGVSAPGLRAASGRLDAKKIASHLGVSLAGLAKITPISRQALNETPDSAHAQAALDPLARILDVLGTVLPPEHVAAWLNTPHARLGGETPIRAILDGQGEQVARMLERARGGGVD
jgi:DNA-binding NarL/FixJ family response regulator